MFSSAAYIPDNDIYTHCTTDSTTATRLFPKHAVSFYFANEEVHHYMHTSTPTLHISQPDTSWNGKEISDSNAAVVPLSHPKSSDTTLHQGAFRTMKDDPLCMASGVEWACCWLGQLDRLWRSR